MVFVMIDWALTEDAERAMYTVGYVPVVFLFDQRWDWSERGHEWALAFYEDSHAWLCLDTLYHWTKRQIDRAVYPPVGPNGEDVWDEEYEKEQYPDGVNVATEHLIYEVVRLIVHETLHGIIDFGLRSSVYHEGTWGPGEEVVSKLMKGWGPLVSLEPIGG